MDLSAATAPACVTALTGSQGLQRPSGHSEGSIERGASVSGAPEKTAATRENGQAVTRGVPLISGRSAAAGRGRREKRAMAAMAIRSAGRESG